MSGALDEFYADLRWPGWKEEVRALNAIRACQCSRRCSLPRRARTSPLPAVAPCP
ncbi:DUF2625 family protein [Streptomyces sp. NPDC127197]|uniref:DUF2625 family protein n=1 Tax=Streptomyces sp. NPDC127197 TaxID=3345388 RepID=UPI0036255836